MSDTAVLATMRRLIIAALAVGMAGTLTELALIGHFEDPAQIVPLVVLTGSLAVVVWHARTRNDASLMVMRVAMICLMAAGAIGVALHFRGNAEFQLEMDPSSRGWTLFATVMRATAPPALAPGNLVLLGALGLIATYGDSARHG